MKISIAVPSYNYSQYLESCLQSILEQDYECFEVLIADGSSTDGSLNIIKRFCNKDQRFRLVSTKDKGQPDALVKAMAMASGDIFCFLNADDCYLCRDALSSVVSAFNNYPQIDIISFGGYYIDSKGKHIKPVRLRYHPLDSIALMKYRTVVLQPATFWHRNVYESVPMLVDHHYSFDSVFFFQVSIKFSWLELSKPVAGHRLHGSNKSLQVNSARIKELAKFEEIKFGPYSYRALYLHIIAAIISIFTKIPIVGALLNRLVYLCVNSLSFISFYRLPNM